MQPDISKHGGRAVQPVPTCAHHGQQMLASLQEHSFGDPQVASNMDATVRSFGSGVQEFWDPVSCTMSRAEFGMANMRESGTSNTSGSIVRQRAFAKALIDYSTGFSDKASTVCCDGNVLKGKIYNTEAHGLMHNNFVQRQLDYVGSEFLGPDKVPGSMHNHSSFGLVRHEDLTHLSFDSNTFDIVMSAEVLEHVPNPYKAHEEIHRVLKVGGAHIFTVPIDDAPSSEDKNEARFDEHGQLWFKAGEDGKPVPHYHGDPLAPNGGVLVFQIFGAGEMMRRLCSIGFDVTAHYYFDPAIGVVSPRGILIFMARKVSRD